MRSGNLGRAEEGGMYVPFDPNRRCLMWVVPKDHGPLFLGAATIVPSRTEPDRYGIYVGDIPEEMSNELRAFFPSESPNPAPAQRP
jgi:hypothetical protein